MKTFIKYLAMGGLAFVAADLIKDTSMVQSLDAKVPGGARTVGALLTGTGVYIGHRLLG